MKSLSKVTILVPDISSNILGAATDLASFISPHVEVDVVGPDLGGGVCPMYRDAWNYRVISCPKMYRYPEFFKDMNRITAALDGDVVIAMKGYLNTVLPALRYRKASGAKIVAYLDEWDGALWRMKPFGVRCRERLQHWHHPLEDLYFPKAERCLKSFDTILSTTTFLQERFGGHVVCQGADTELFAPQSKSDNVSLRAEYGLTGKKVVVFGGVVRPHKGVEQIVEAINLTGRDDLVLFVVGPETDHLKAMMAEPRFAGRIQCAGSQRKPDMPKFLSVADLIVLPLIPNLLAQSQMPCKIFEALAMAKPVIATDVSDLSDVLKGCGGTVPPNEPAALARAMEAYLNYPEKAKEAGAAAREKCLSRYSRTAASDKIWGILQSL